MDIKKNKIRIGNAGGYWGDDKNAFRNQLLYGNLSYLTLDYLAELTMSILRKQQIKNPDLGYVPDILYQIQKNIDLIIKNKVKIITNAGGLNPIGCGNKILDLLKKYNLDNTLKIAVVYGDNILPEIEKFNDQDFINLDNTSIPFSDIKNKLQIANVYFGVSPILYALEEGADIIITGRVTDASLAMAPLIYEFHWNIENWDLMASSLIAGHLIECGTQVTGGNFTDWHLIKNWKLGYPIIEGYEDGSFIVTKYSGSGGIINTNTIKEQLLYEVEDPNNYFSPDVIADFNSIIIEEKEQNMIWIKNAKGKAPTNFYKVSMGYEDGYKISGELILSGPNVLKKAQIVQEIIECKISKEFYRYNVDWIGYNSCHGSLVSLKDTNEILIRFSAHDYDKEKLEEFSRIIPSIILSAPPGITYTGGRQKISEVIAYYPTLIEKSSIKSNVMVLNPENKHFLISSPIFEKYSRDFNKNNVQISGDIIKFDLTKIYEEDKKYIEVSFYDICLARSGDKGDKINIGVIARSKEIYDFLKENLTSDFMKFLFKDICKGKVYRYEAPNLNAFNFVLENSLDGGGTRSLRIDTQGKTIAQAFLNQRIKIPEELLITIRE